MIVISKLFRNFDLSKLNKMTTKKVKLKDWQVAYLSCFMNRWDDFPGEDYSALIREYNEFLIDCKLPSVSADDLLAAERWRKVK